MAKIDVICPFSNGLCKDCAYYRGRHYYLCFSKEYRGYLGRPRRNSKQVKYQGYIGKPWTNFKQVKAPLSEKDLRERIDLR